MMDNNTQDYSSEGADDDKVLARLTLGESSYRVPDGATVHMKVELQEDGAVYVSHYIALRDGGVEPGPTCIYCAGKKLGCLTCPKGQSVDADCTNRTMKCTVDSSIQEWTNATVVFQ